MVHTEHTAKAVEGGGAKGAVPPPGFLGGGIAPPPEILGRLFTYIFKESKSEQRKVIISYIKGHL